MPGFSFRDMADIQHNPAAFDPLDMNNYRADRMPKMKKSKFETWMARLGDECIFISALNKTNVEAFRSLVYQHVRKLHVQKYPYNDFLYTVPEDLEQEEE